MSGWFTITCLAATGPSFIRSYPFEEMFFLPEAREVRRAVRVPLVLLGGILSLANLERAMDEGFDFVAMGRALIADPDLVLRMQRGEAARSRCISCNECVAEMDRGGVRCVLGGWVHHRGTIWNARRPTRYAAKSLLSSVKTLFVPSRSARTTSVASAKSIGRSSKRSISAAAREMSAAAKSAISTAAAATKARSARCARRLKPRRYVASVRTASDVIRDARPRRASST